MLLLLLPVAAWAEIHIMTLTVDKPLLDVSGNTLGPKDITGYRWYVSMDEPFTSLEGFAGEPVETDVVWHADTGEVIDDATSLPITHKFPDEISNHTVYVTAVVRGWGGLDSVPFMPVVEIQWEVVATPAVTPNPPRNLRFIDRICSTGNWRRLCNILGP